MTEGDHKMALMLQQQFDIEDNMDVPGINWVYTPNNSDPDYSPGISLRAAILLDSLGQKIHAARAKKSRFEGKSLVDPSWELIDPTPNVHMLFLVFNEKYFWNKLLSVCVDWSKRMTSCAGICTYQGYGGLCRISLSEPLLKLRPRKDLVETLLHEMIHAYLFITNNNRDRDGHGGEFCKHMHRINSVAGTHITIYHDFHEEVRLYQQHWWRCNGPCQNRKPYFGMVRRAVSRAPNSKDFWWAEHQRSCGGYFIKVKEPEKPKKAKKEEKENIPVAGSSNSDLRNFYPVVNGKSPSDGYNKPCTSSSSSNIVGFKDLNGTRPRNAVSNSSSTIVINDKQTRAKSRPESRKSSRSSTPEPFSGTGQTLGGKRRSESPDSEAARKQRAKKYAPEKSPLTTLIIERPSVGYNQALCPVCQKVFHDIELNDHLDWCLEQRAESNEPPRSKCPVCQRKVPFDDFDKHIALCLDKDDENHKVKPELKQELISCLVCNKLIPKDDLNVHLDECMGDDIFKIDDDDDDAKEEEGEKTYNCPVCFEKFLISEMGGHLDGCLLNDNETAKDDSVVNSVLNEPF